METALHKVEKQPLRVPLFKLWRSYVDNEIGNPEENILVKALYLTASRFSELATQQYECEQDKTSIYGAHLTCSFEQCEKPRDTLVIQIAVAKRKETVFKSIALPIPYPDTPKYEPWCGDLIRHIAEHKTLAFPMTRQVAYHRVRHALGGLDAKMYGQLSPHSLRHYRLSHLLSEYGFTPTELVSIAGWTFKGAGLHGMLDRYIHFDWRSSYQKLLKPLPS